VGAALLAVHPVHVERSHLAYPDALMVCLMAAALYVMARERGKEPAYRTDVLVGLLIGLAAAAKYLGAFVLVAYLIWRLGTAWTRRGPKLTALHVLLGGGACVVGFFIGMPTFLMRIAQSWSHVSGAVVGNTHWDLTAQNILHRIWRDVFTAKGIGPLGTLLAGAGIVWGVRRRPAYTLGLIAMIAVNVIWATRLARFMPRWIFPSTLALCLLGGLSVGWLTQLRASRVWRLALVGISLCCLPVLLWPSATLSARQAAATAGPDTRLLAKKWIEENIPAGSSILIDDATYSSPQLRANRESLERMIRKSQGIDNPRYHYVTTYYRYQIAALGRYNGPSYDIHRLSHVWFRPAVEADSDLYHQRSQIPVVPGRDLAVPFQEYLRRGVEYVVVNTSSLKHYANDKFPLDKRFYQDLLTATEEIKRFKPDEKTSGPEIIILRTANARDANRGVVVP